MRWIAITVMVAACGKGDSKAAGSGSAAGSSTEKASAAPPADAAAAAALSPKIKAARCGEPCLFLVDTELAQLGEAYQTACAGMKAHDAELKQCDELDYDRNCVYAAHGVVYKQKRWKKLFAEKPWYEPNPAADAKTVLSALELANVHELNRRGMQCKTNVGVSDADFDRLTKWFKVLPKVPPMPKVVVGEGWGDAPATTGKAFVKNLLDELDKSGKHVKFDEKTSGRYVKLSAAAEVTEMPEQLRDALAKVKPEPRVIELNFDSGATGTEDNPYSAGVFVWFAYSDKDELVAIGAKPYAWD